MSVENVFRVAALSVFSNVFCRTDLFSRSRRSPGTFKTASPQRKRCATLGKVLANPKFMIFLLIFFRLLDRLLAGIHHPADLRSRLCRPECSQPNACLSHRPASGDCVLRWRFSVLTQKIAAFRAVACWGRWFSMGGVLRFWRCTPAFYAAYATLVVIAVGELIQQPRYYDYISRAGAGGASKGRTWAFCVFCRWEIGSFSGGTDWRRAAAPVWRSAAPAAAFFFGPLTAIGTGHNFPAVDLRTGLWKTVGTRNRKNRK